MLRRRGEEEIGRIKTHLSEKFVFPQTIFFFSILLFLLYSTDNKAQIYCLSIYITKCYIHKLLTFAISKSALKHHEEGKITLIIKASSKVIKHPFDGNINIIKYRVQFLRVIF